MKKNKNKIKIIAFIFFVLFFYGFSIQDDDTVIQKQITRRLEIHVIDVGQGDCFLIVSPSGKKF
jgi:beta-lactamase superfamily II metal-dependent hydrolase